MKSVPSAAADTPSSASQPIAQRCHRDVESACPIDTFTVLAEEVEGAARAELWPNLFCSSAESKAGVHRIHVTVFASSCSNDHSTVHGSHWFGLAVR
jgi:hypothetical protein